MMVLTWRKRAWAGGLGLLCAFAMSADAEPLYNLVQGLEKFDGSPAAWHLLETNGFVVTDPEFKAIFEPYLDNSLPAFITVDSAWQTYHCLFEEGITQLRSRGRPSPDFAALPGWLTNDIDPNQPSGLDFLVGSRELRSDAAVRALRQAQGAQAVETLENQPSPSWPDSLPANAMRLLATLEQPLPRGLAPAFRSPAWMDLQLWTQLGAWTEQCHAGAIRPKAEEEFRGEINAPTGVVAPYPDFFSGLAALSRQAAQTLAEAGLDAAFDSKITARKLLDGILWEQTTGANQGSPDQETELKQDQIAQFDQFIEDYRETHRNEMAAGPEAAQKLMNDLEPLATRCLTDGSPSQADLGVLRAFFDHRQTIPQLLRQLAPVCDHLALLARKSLDGVPLTEQDQAWIGRYGMTLARLDFYENPEAGLRDDSPMVDRLCGNSGGQSVFQAALGHPQALYLIVPFEGRLRLFRGAVMSCREFVRPAAQVLTDESWRALDNTGNAPPPPAFTRTFFAQKNTADLLASLDTAPEDAPDMNQLAQTLAELQSRATDGDLPVLIAALGKNRAESPLPVAEGIAAAIAGLNWAPRQSGLIALLDKDDGQHAASVVAILSRRPDWLDIAFLRTNFNAAPPRARRVYCALLARQPMDNQSRAALLAALHDSAAAVRWQAALALAKPSTAAGENAAPLLERLSDENPLVAVAAAYALGRSGATNSAPALLAKLEQLLAAPELSDEASERAAETIRDFALLTPGQTNYLDPDGLAMRLQPGFGRMRRFVGPMMRASFDQLSPVNAVIESLGDLKYEPAEERIFGLLDGSHAMAAAKAMQQLAPEKLTGRLTSIACDKNAAAQSRDDALLLLAAYPSPNPVAALAPLLDDTTIVPGRRLLAGREWRICDRAAGTIATLLGRTSRIVPMQTTDLRDREIEEVRQWLKSAY